MASNWEEEWGGMVGSSKYCRYIYKPLALEKQITFWPNFKDTPASESDWRCNKSGLGAQRRKWLLLGGLRKMTQRRRKHFYCVRKSWVTFLKQVGSSAPDSCGSDNGTGDSRYRHQDYLRKELCLPRLSASQGLFLGLIGFYSLFHG